MDDLPPPDAIKILNRQFVDYVVRHLEDCLRRSKFAGKIFKGIGNVYLLQDFIENVNPFAGELFQLNSIGERTESMQINGCSRLLLRPKFSVV